MKKIIIFFSVLLLGCNNPMQDHSDVKLDIPLSFVTSTTNTTLSTTIRDGFVVWTGSTVGSQTISWASDQIISTEGVHLSFALFHNVGDTTTISSFPDTVATLIEKTGTGASLKFTTELKYPISKILERNLTTLSITLINIDSGARLISEINTIPDV